MLSNVAFPGERVMGVVAQWDLMEKTMAIKTRDCMAVKENPGLYRLRIVPIIADYSQSFEDLAATIGPVFQSSRQGSVNGKATSKSFCAK
jgi:hypothetical protein